MRTNGPHQWADEGGAPDRRQPYAVDEYGVRTDRPGQRPPDSRPRQKKKTSPLKITLIVMAVLLVLTLIVVAAGGIYLWTMFGKVNYEELEILPPEPVQDRYDPVDYGVAEVADIPLMGDTEDVTNILLMGVDSSDFEGRADTNIILSVNTKEKTVKMASLMRDTWVTLPGIDEDGDGWDDDDRLNAAYSYGSTKLHMGMIAQNFRLHIDKYVAVNFEAFPAVVDAMGGVDVPCRGDEAERVPAAGTTVTYGGAGYQPMGTEEGTYHMDGFQALQYARIRYLDADGDFSRTSRQRKLISLMLEQMKGLGLSDLHEVLSGMLAETKTNMSRSTLMGLAIQAIGYKDYTIDTSYRVPQDGLWEDANLYGMSVLRLTDPVASVSDLHRYLYAEKDE